jgi:hypothetical protein
MIAFQLFDLMAHDLELLPQLRNLVLRLEETFRVMVAIRSHGLVELLLLLQLGLLKHNE